MSALEEFTSLLWWLMLLSSTGIILQDIGSAIFPKTRAQRPMPPQKRLSNVEAELDLYVKKVKRGLQRPTSFRILQREVAETIAQTALAARGLALSRIPESQRGLIKQIVKDPGLTVFLEAQLGETSKSRPPTPRGKMLLEFETSIIALQKAETMFK